AAAAGPADAAAYRHLPWTGAGRGEIRAVAAGALQGNRAAAAGAADRCHPRPHRCRHGPRRAGLRHVMGYPVLLVAIVLEVIGTSFLMASQQFTRLVPTAIMALAYLASFYFLSQALRYMPLGIA